MDKKTHEGLYVDLTYVFVHCMDAENPIEVSTAYGKLDLRVVQGTLTVYRIEGPTEAVMAIFAAHEWRYVITQHGEIDRPAQMEQRANNAVAWGGFYDPTATIE